MDERRDLVDREELRRRIKANESAYDAWSYRNAMHLLDAMPSVEQPVGMTRDDVLAALDAAADRGDEAVVDKRWTVDGGTGRSDATLTWGNGSGHISIDWSSKDPRWWSEIYTDDRAALAALVADVQVAARVRNLAALFEAGRASDELGPIHGADCCAWREAAQAVRLLEADADARSDKALRHDLAATFDSHLNRDQTYTGAQVAAMLRDGEG